MLRVRTLAWLVRNHFILRDPAARPNSGPNHTLLFFLNLLPPYNVGCLFWIKLALAFPRISLARHAAAWLVRRGYLYGALRHISPEDRQRFVAWLALEPEANANPTTLSATAIAAEIRASGYAPLGPILTKAEAADAVEYFRKQLGYVAQVPMQSDGVLRPFDVERLCALRGGARYFCFPPSASLNCPQLRAALREPRLRDCAAAYLKREPELYSVNTFATLRGDRDHYVLHMHRDYDAFACLAIFICWTDVSTMNGATAYVPGSHVSSAVPLGHTIHLTGAAGHGFALEPFGLHAGNPSVEEFRLVTWLRFGAIPNLATVQDGCLIPQLG